MSFIIIVKIWVSGGPDPPTRRVSMWWPENETKQPIILHFTTLRCTGTVKKVRGNQIMANTKPRNKGWNTKGRNWGQWVWWSLQLPFSFYEKQWISDMEHDWGRQQLWCTKSKIQLSTGGVGWSIKLDVHY